MLRRITKILSQLVLVLLLLLATLWVVIQFSPVQTWLVKQAARQLSRDLGAEVQVQRVDFSLFKKVLLEGVLVRDQQKDTLAYIGRAGVRMNNWFFLKNKAVIYELTLEDLYARLHRTDSVWNYQFIVDYFAAPSTGKKKTSAFEVQLRKLRFDRIRILQRDEWAGQDLEGNLRSLVLDANRISLQEQRIDINRILVNAPSFAISNYEGRKPPRKGMDENLFHRVNDTIPPEPFLPGWQVLAGSLLINDGVFTNDIRTVRPPYPYFDGEHIRFYDINAGFGNIALSGDSLRAKINLSLREQSGLEVTRLNANFNWHGRGMEFHELLLETPRSRLGNFFALRYNNFNHDMSRFINHVRMEGHFEKSRLHSDDIAFFAPELKDWDDVIELSGNARGTLDHLKGDNIVVTTGKNTRLEGKFTMDGLPDINTTFLD
ncbi:MAG TPA: hypothetical protein PKE63_11490, partial [Lacibacter sp.]|nr:hypothetical protein [Lacibacter sp.]